MKRKILFVDRDGTLIEEPEDFQVDALDKVRLLPGVIPALLQFQNAGYELVMVTNQDGLGTDAFPEADFHPAHDLMLHLFNSQGIEFSATHIDPHFEQDQAPTRKPGIGMVIDYLKSGDLDLQRSYVIGDRETDLQLAWNMGIQGIRVGPEGVNWPDIVDQILNADRVGEQHRKTSETDIRVKVNLDQEGPQDISTGIGFFDHMLEQLGAHGGFRIDLQADGDLHIDEHHTVEDCALALGAAIGEALGDRRGIGRYGFTLPMDESLADVAVDLSGRPVFVLHDELPRDRIGELTTDMVRHFFQSLAQSLGAAIHIRISGDNLHHQVEAMFKGTGRALRPALSRAAGSSTSVPSTKGCL